MKLKFFIKKSRPGALIFLSGTGTNAEKLLESPACGESWRCLGIVTDRPDSSRAGEIAARFHLPLIRHDIAAFYREHGRNKVTLATADGIQIREKWTEELRKKTAPFHPDFGILAGFVPLTNLVGDMPCLNVHPGDLTWLENGKRVFVGLHRLPVERAILNGPGYLRSSVIIVTPFTPGKIDVDAGPLLGISEKVPVVLPEGVTVEDLKKIAAARVKGVKARDPLEKIANRNIDRLKKYGDWRVFPAVVDEFARGKYALDENNTLYWNDGSEWLPVKTVEYLDGKGTPVRI